MRLVVLLALLLVSACAAPADIAYTPRTPPPNYARPLIATVTVVDHRGQAAHDFGAVIGPDGKPFRILRSPDPVADAVGRAFHDALAARGLLAPAGYGRYDLDVTVLGLDAEHWVDRQGEADLEVKLVDRATGRTVYSARTGDGFRGTNYLAMDNGVLGSPAALAGVANYVLDSAIDETLDRRGFLLALR